MNHEGAGAAKSKGGDNVRALSRAAGMAATVSAVQNKVRSHYKGSEKHSHWEGCGGYGSNENIVGYGRQN